MLVHSMERSVLNAIYNFLTTEQANFQDFELPPFFDKKLSFECAAGRNQVLGAIRGGEGLGSVVRHIFWIFYAVQSHSCINWHASNWHAGLTWNYKGKTNKYEVKLMQRWLSITREFSLSHKASVSKLINFKRLSFCYRYPVSRSQLNCMHESLFTVVCRLLIEEFENYL